MITDAHGTPLAVTLTGRHRSDVTPLIPLPSPGELADMLDRASPVGCSR